MNGPSKLILIDYQLATVAKVLTEFRLIINRGAQEGVKEGMTYLIYEMGEEIIDPETDLSLGNLEITKGQGRVINVQPKMATIESTLTKRVQANTLISLSTGNNYETVKAPFNGAKVGDRAKFIG